MSSQNMLNSSLGKKLVMGITGIFLIKFLLVHCAVNCLVFLNDGGEAFNEAAEFMATNPLIRIVEIVLFLGLIMHAVQALKLTRANSQAREVQYSSYAGDKNSKWYSRSMGLLGTLILIFLIVHLKHFWFVSRLTDEITSGEDTLFGEMQEVFQNPMVVILYVLAMISLAYHLLHGFQSAFQTLGLNHKRYTPTIKKIGVIYAIVIPVLFALMPIAFYLGLIQ